MDKNSKKKDTKLTIFGLKIEEITYKHAEKNRIHPLDLKQHKHTLTVAKYMEKGDNRGQ